MPPIASHTPVRSRQKIVHLTSVHPPFDPRIFHKECKSLARAGYRVTLIVAHHRDEAVDGVRVRSIARPANRAVRMLRTPWVIFREALRQQADVYHFHDPELIPVALLLRARGKIVIYDAHEDVSVDIAFKHYLPHPLRRPVAQFVSLFEKTCARFFSAVVAATAPIARRFSRRNPRCVVVGNYPSCAAAADPVKPWAARGNTVVYAGLLSPDRCIREILQAMNFIPENLPVQLNFAGSFSPPAYGQEIALLEKPRRAAFLGMLDLPRLSGLLQDARAGLCLCAPTPGYLESAPTKIFEYMHAGIPVIASDFAAFREIVCASRCGLLVDPRDPRAIAAAIQYLLTHPEEAEQMGVRGREAARARFTWATEERKLLALYAGLLASRPARSPDLESLAAQEMSSQQEQLVHELR